MTATLEIAHKAPNLYCIAPNKVVLHCTTLHYIAIIQTDNISLYVLFVLYIQLKHLGSYYSTLQNLLLALLRVINMYCLLSHSPRKYMYYYYLLLLLLSSLLLLLFIIISCVVFVCLFYCCYIRFFLLYLVVNVKFW